MVAKKGVVKDSWWAFTKSPTEPINIKGAAQEATAPQSSPAVRETKMVVSRSQIPIDSLIPSWNGITLLVTLSIVSDIQLKIG